MGSEMCIRDRYRNDLDNVQCRQYKPCTAAYSRRMQLSAYPYSSVQRLQKKRCLERGARSMVKRSRQPTSEYTPPHPLEIYVAVKRVTILVVFSWRYLFLVVCGKNYQVKIQIVPNGLWRQVSKHIYHQHAQSFL